MSSSPGVSTTPHKTAPVYEDLRKRILRFLHLKNVSGIEDINAEVKGGVVTLSGRVSTARMKALCVEYCRHVAGVLHVLDDLSTRDAQAQELPSV